MRSLVSVMLAALAFVAGTGLSMASARAQSTNVVVLGLTSLEGDDTFATNLSGALRAAASQVRGWAVSDRDVPLSQLELATGCDATELACVHQIATTVGAERLVYGTIQRDGAGSRFQFRIQIHLYDTASNTILRSLDERLPSTRTDIDDLREPARNYASALAGASGATVGSGAGLPPEGETGGGETGGGESGGGEIGGEQTPTSGGGDDIGRLNWPAFALLAVAVGGAIGWIVTGLDAQANAQRVDQFRAAAVMRGGVGGPICDPAVINEYREINAGVEAACTSPAEVLQFVFLGVTAVAGATGIGLLAANGVMSPASSETDRARLRILPAFGPQGGSLGLHLTF
ncbi:MAG: hypothetical protein OHK0013_12730 [Sandaracinaceae bacterium]